MASNIFDRRRVRGPEISHPPVYSLKHFSPSIPETAGTGVGRKGKERAGEITSDDTGYVDMSGQKNVSATTHGKSASASSGGDATLRDICEFSSAIYLIFL